MDWPVLEQILYDYGARRRASQGSSLENDISKLDKDPTESQYNEKIAQIEDTVRNTRGKVVLLCLFQGYGMRKDGSQEFMFNQYDNSTHFYKMVSVERELRRLARENRNLYVVSTFACVNLKSIKEDCLPAVPKEIFSEEQSESQELTKEIITSD